MVKEKDLLITRGNKSTIQLLPPLDLIHYLKYFNVYHGCLTDALFECHDISKYIEQLTKWKSPREVTQLR